MHSLRNYIFFSSFQECNRAIQSHKLMKTTENALAHKQTNNNKITENSKNDLKKNFLSHFTDQI